MSLLENVILKSLQYFSLRRVLGTPLRELSSGSGQSLGPNEEKLKSILIKTFPQAKLIEVNDISGGCGAMFEIAVEAAELKGLSIVKQHRLVTEALKEEIKDMHGLRIHTSVPS